MVCTVNPATKDRRKSRRGADEDETRGQTVHPSRLAQEFGPIEPPVSRMVDLRPRHGLLSAAGENGRHHML